MAQRAAIRPSTIEAPRAIRQLRELEKTFCPFALSDSVVLGRASKDAKLESKSQKGQCILRWFADAGP